MSVNVSRKTALITGASSGIGRALAHTFAREGFDLVIVSRDATRLRELARECESAYRAQVTLVALDLSQPNAVTTLRSELESQGIEVDALVHNAGFGLYGPFLDNDGESADKMIRLQVNALTELCRCFLPSMLRRKQGWLLTVGSLYSFVPVSNQAAYSACKAFLLNFTEALAGEIEEQGVNVTVLCPGAVRTEFRKRARIREKRPDAGMSSQAVAEAGYKALMRGKRIVVPGFWNKLFVVVTRFLPPRAVTALMLQIARIRGLGASI